jgi:hypothetical protein
VFARVRWWRECAGVVWADGAILQESVGKYKFEPPGFETPFVRYQALDRGADTSPGQIRET